MKFHTLKALLWWVCFSMQNLWNIGFSFKSWKSLIPSHFFRLSNIYSRMQSGNHIAFSTIYVFEHIEASQTKRRDNIYVVIKVWWILPFWGHQFTNLMVQTWKYSRMNSAVEKWDKNSVFEQSFDFTPVKSEKNNIEYFISTN